MKGRERMSKRKVSIEKAKEIREAKGYEVTKLQNLRIERGFSQHTLAVASKVPKRAIQAYEQKDREIDRARLETICSLCATLNCKIEDILEDKELIELYRVVK